MNEKLDFQEMKSIHEIMVTRRDIPWLGTYIQEAFFNDETGIPLHIPLRREKNKGSHKEIDCYCRRYFLFSLTAIFSSKMCLVVPTQILVLPILTLGPVTHSFGL
jgi:hypothetical protein